MSSNSPFQPPEAVVPPAFSELLNRMQRARPKSGERAPMPSLDSASMNEDERKVFAYGIDARKRVIENTLTLVFGQWLVHRVAVRRVSVPPLRALYVAGCVVSTLSYVRNRVTKVSTEMFAKIATLPVTSPMANEARIILAELEGPDGEYFRTICRENNFAEDLHALVASMESDDDDSSHNQNLHPQLRLRPRLVPGPGKSSPPQVGKSKTVIVRGNGIEAPRRSIDSDFASKDRDIEDTLPATNTPLVVRKSAQAREDVEPVPSEDDFRKSRFDKHGAQRYEPVQEDYDSATGWGRANGTASEPDYVEQDSLGFSGQPFDFAAAAGGRQRYTQESDYESGSASQKTSMTPSQIRATERRERRRRAKERVQQDQETNFESRDRW